MDTSSTNLYSLLFLLRQLLINRILWKRRNISLCSVCNCFKNDVCRCSGNLSAKIEVSRDYTGYCAWFDDRWAKFWQLWNHCSCSATNCRAITAPNRIAACSPSVASFCASLCLRNFWLRPELLMPHSGKAPFPCPSPFFPFFCL